MVFWGYIFWESVIARSAFSGPWQSHGIKRYRLLRCARNDFLFVHLLTVADSATAKHVLDPVRDCSLISLENPSSLLSLTGLTQSISDNTIGHFVSGNSFIVMDSLFIDEQWATNYELKSI